MLGSNISARTALIVGSLALFSGAALYYVLVLLPVQKRLEAGPGELSRAIAIASRENIPTTPDQLNHEMPAPSLNAAPLYTRLAAELRGDPLPGSVADRLRKTDPFSAWLPMEKDGIQHELGRRRDWMTLLRRAVAIPDCMFVRNWSEGPGVQYPELGAMRTSAEMLRADACLSCQSGDEGRGLSDLREIFRLSRHAASDPVLAGFMAGEVCEANGLTAASDLLEIAGSHPGFAARVYSMLQLRKEPVLARAVGGDIVILLRELRLMADGRLKQVPLPSSGDGAVEEHAGEAANWTIPTRYRTPSRASREWIDAGAAWLLNRCLEMTRACALPIPERISELRTISKRPSRESLPLILGMPVDPEGYLAPLLPPVLHAAESGARVDSMAAVVDAGAAILAYKDRAKEYPDTLVLAAPSPIDPATGQLLEYVREGNGFSVSAAASREAGEPGGPKLVFRYPGEERGVTGERPNPS